MNIMEAVKYPFKDSNWVTKFLFSFIALVPVVGLPALAGYQLKAIRENAEKDMEDLPEWNDWLNLIIQGFIATIITFIYLLPPVLLITVSILPMVAGMIIGAVGVSAENEIGSIVALISTILGPVTTVILICIGSLWALISCLLLPMATGVYAVTGNFIAAINPFGLMAKIFRCFGGYIIVLIAPVGLGLMWGVIVSVIGAIPFLGGIILGILSFVSWPVNFYFYMVISRLIGSLFRENPALS